MAGGKNKLRELLADELPLIAFTTCAPAAVGTCLVALVAGIVEFALYGAWTSGWKLAAVSVIYTTAGMAASVLHLAKPLRAPRSLTNVASSWLSREILAVSAFWAVLVAWLLIALVAGNKLPFVVFESGMRSAISLGACAVACLAGAFLIHVIARAYRVHGQPGWNGPEATTELVACALRVGVPSAACVMLLDGSPLHPLAACVLGCAGIAVAAAFDRAARDARARRLEAELADGANPHGRVPVALKGLGEWSSERAYALAVSAAAAVFLVLACLVPALASAATILCIICTVASQVMMRATFYGLCDPSRTVPRFL